MERLLRAGEVAERLGLHRNRVYELSARGILPSIKLGHTVRYDRRTVEDFLANGGTKDRSEREGSK